MRIELTKKELKHHINLVEQLAMSTGCDLVDAESQIETAASCSYGHLVEIGYFADFENKEQEKCDFIRTQLGLK